MARSVFTQAEWRQIIGKLVKICSVENIGTGKRATRASREAIANCVRNYAREIVRKRIEEKKKVDVEALKRELGLI
ncbi:MAG: hypothetical protein GSR72_00250 [Desulfurococcales archaeon]|nr:hypothetical protein [Desulfurococcales archaeon]